MARKLKTKDVAGDALGGALDKLDEMHAAVIALGTAAGLQAEAEDELTFSDGDDLPVSTFEIGELGDELPRGVVAALETRLTLSMNDAQAEALAFAILREIRAGGDEIEVELDGRWLLDRTAAGDLRGALKKGAD